MQHSPGVVGGVAEAAAEDRVGMGPVNTRTNKSLWRMSIIPMHGSLQTYPPSRTVPAQGFVGAIYLLDGCTVDSYSPGPALIQGLKKYCLVSTY